MRTSFMSCSMKLRNPGSYQSRVSRHMAHKKEQEQKAAAQKEAAQKAQQHAAAAH